MQATLPEAPISKFMVRRSEQKRMEQALIRWTQGLVERLNGSLEGSGELDSLLNKTSKYVEGYLGLKKGCILESLAAVVASVEPSQRTIRLFGVFIIYTLGSRIREDSVRALNSMDQNSMQLIVDLIKESTKLLQSKKRAQEPDVVTELRQELLQNRLQMKRYREIIRMQKQERDTLLKRLDELSNECLGDQERNAFETELDLVRSSMYEMAMHSHKNAFDDLYEDVFEAFQIE